MRETGALIEALAAEAAPVRRLRPAAQRAAAWLLFAACLLGAVLASHGTRADLAARLNESAFCVCLAGSLGTGVLAAFAACMIAEPDRRPAWALLPLPGMLLWFGTISYGCLADWVGLSPGSVRAGEALACLGLLLGCGVPLSAAMLWLLRRAMPLRPARAVALGALAASGLTASALTLLHPVASSALVLAWNGGTLALLLAADLAAGRRLLRPPVLAPRGAD